jgi:enterochelin esterase-like enzyme
MRSTLCFGLFLAGAVLLSNDRPAEAVQDDPDAQYVLGPDSQRQDGVPKGKLSKHTWKSMIFEDTIREYQVYVPEQYDGTQPACLMVFQDGHAYSDVNGQFRVPVVFDNLIHRGELPVTICLFVNPGHKGDTLPENRWRGSNRSFEYDTLSDQYARFIVKELLPHVVKEQSFNVSDDPEDRAICGISSGGICAFTVAWEHPEWFRKVLSHVGSFTNIRGGHNYEALIRKEPLRPIRVFLQDGANDLNNQHGNWWLANQQMASSLGFRDYDYKFVGGTGGHNGKHGGAILPESLKWLWRDHVTGFPIDSDSDAVDATEVYEDLSVTYSGGDYSNEEFHYRFMRPPSIENDQKYPLVIFLHGAGERGDDNAAQLQYFPEMMAQPAWRARFPCYVLAPQCRTDRKWANHDWSAAGDPKFPEEPSEQMQTVMQMLKRAMADEQVDPQRIYLTGLSMGGYGTWDLAARHPELFAAVAPICGGSDPATAKLFSHLPIWVVHGGADGVVSVERSRSMVAALKEAGGNPVYVEIPGVGHNSWTPGYEDPDGLIPWLFRQKKQVHSVK